MTFNDDDGDVVVVRIPKSVRSYSTQLDSDKVQAGYSERKIANEKKGMFIMSTLSPDHLDPFFFHFTNSSFTCIPTFLELTGLHGVCKLLEVREHHSFLLISFKEDENKKKKGEVSRLLHS